MDWRQTAKVRGAWVRVAGQRLFMRAAEGGDRHGQRPPIVLVHGIFASSRYMVPLARLLGRRYRVYLPDLPGVGRSRWRGPMRSIDAMADLLHAWMDAMAIRRAVFIGNSMGCQVIASLAARYPRAAAAVVLTAPTVDPRHRTWLGQAARLLADVPRESLPLVAIVAADALRLGPVAGLQMIRQALADRIEMNLPRITCPGLVIAGSCDPLVPVRWARAAAALLPRGEVVIIDNASHAVHVSAVEAVGQRVERFIVRCTAADMNRGVAT